MFVSLAPKKGFFTSPSDGEMVDQRSMQMNEWKGSESALRSMQSALQ